MDDLLQWRKEFPTLENTVYLLNHSLGAMPRGVYSCLKKYADVWSTQPAEAWEESWWNMNAVVGGLAADILHAPRNTVSIHANVTSATAVFLSCFAPARTKDTVVYTGMHFPSIRYLMRSFYGAGITHRIIETEDGITVPAEKIADAIDERTLLVPISHVFYRSSYLQQVEAIIEKAHAAGAHVILDVYQSAGTVPIDVEKMKVDAVVGGSIKWLCGGPGTAFLYVRPDLAATLKPKITGWFAHESPLAFSDEMKYTENIGYRFLNGTPHIPALYAAQAGFEIIRSAGVDAVRRKSLALTQRIMDYAHEHGIPVNTPAAPGQRGGTVVVQPENSRKIAQELTGKNFLVDWRPDAGIRISPHFYNTEDEVDAVMEEISRLSAGYSR